MSKNAQNDNRFGLIESVHGRYLKVKITVHAPIKAMKNDNILNLETTTDVFIRQLSWNLQCDTVCHSMKFGK
jgi:hypothetical protein